MKMDAEFRKVSDSLREEVVKVLGFPGTPGWRKLCSLLFGKAMDHLAEISLTFDKMIADIGFGSAAEWSLGHWCREIQVRGSEYVPSHGPLLIISNHPGAYDALVISAQLPRPDLHLIASDLPFFHSLRNFSRRLFFIPINIKNAAGRMAGMISAVRCLKQGGAVLLMGSGTIDPDPAVYPGAAENLHRWTEAVDLFSRFVPQIQIMCAVVSHIVSPKWASHPLTWLQRGGMEKRRVAEFGQVIQQLFFPGSLYVSPRLSFSPALTVKDLGESPRIELIRRECTLLETHCETFGGILH